MSTERAIEIPEFDLLGSLPDETDTSSLMAQIRTLKAQVVQQETKVASILEISNALRATRSEGELLNLIMEKISLLMDADRSTLFLKDETTNELWTKLTQGSRTIEVRLAMGQGIAGWVAQAGQSINIKDAYQDPRFNPDIDFTTGYETTSILCQPMRNQERQIIGVIQVLNKQHGYFTIDDELLLSSVASQAAIMIENSNLYHSVLEANYELNETHEMLQKKLDEQDTLVGLQQSLSMAVGLEEVIKTIADKAMDMVPSLACAVTLDEGNDYALYLLRASAPGREVGSLEITRSVHKNDTSAVVFDEGSPSLWNNQDQRPANSTLSRLGIILHSTAAVPLFTEEKVFGCVELINKRGVTNDGKRAEFDRGHLKLLTLLAGQVDTTLAAELFRTGKEKADRLAAVGQMLSGVLHDFKTPVTIISGYVQLMSGEDDNAVRGDYAQSISKQFDLLNQMTGEILLFVRGERTILLSKVYLNLFMADVTENLTKEFEDMNIELEVDTQYRRTARFDEGKMKRVIFNLARNAIEAMPQGGRFTVCVSLEDEETLAFRFSDTGEGIPEEIRARLFESFVTSGKRNGTGLGLAIVKKIVEEHNGQISFDSRPGQGTTFEILLPLDP